VVGRGWGQLGEMNQSLYAHMNNKRKMKEKKNPVDLNIRQLSFMENVHLILKHRV
jgi:hypothetical protein